MLGRLSRNPENLVANTGGKPSNGRRVCRAVRPVMVDNGILVVEGLGPVGFFGTIFQHTTLARSSPKTGGQMWPHLINRLATSCPALAEGGSQGQSSDGHSWQMYIVRVYQPPTPGTRGAGEPHTPVTEY